MTADRRLYISLALVALLSTAGLFTLGKSTDGNAKIFVGICVRAEKSYSLLFNSTDTLLVPGRLKVGRLYLISGEIKETKAGLRVNGRYSIEEPQTRPAWLEEIEGAYWTRGRKQYVLTPDWVELGRPLDVRKGNLVKALGVKYGSKFYPMEVISAEEPPRSIRDGMPALVRGTVLGTFGSDNRVVLWNGSERLYVYLPHGQSLERGLLVEILGRIRITSRVNVYVDDMSDVRKLGHPKALPVGETSIGEIGEGRCLVLRVMKSGLQLNCTALKLRGFEARAGDTVEVRALNTGSSLVCLDCRLSLPRERLPNGVCNFREGMFSRVSGRVEWVKRYNNGFTLANVTSGKCWVLLKLPKSLGVEVEEGTRVTAYGTFTDYRGKPALQVSSGDDVCSGNC
ncbi:hypothetical protein [Thermococcus sp. AM4]|uniref:hypothetical protein n=1 Tax=Thermococcus sp. (strain AM4) TaxID=246969 RepID=UPI000186FC39|nr:hypothetical protein [Thermococcus sp. AM4]EEB74650.1 conserved hypothetical protein [Thermococcus sp. AM4]